MKKDSKARERSLRAVEMLGSAIDIKINELTDSNRQLKRKIFDLYTIFEISRNFSSVLNYKTLVGSFLLTSLGQVVASAAALYLSSPHDPNLLVCYTSKGLPHFEESGGGIKVDGRLSQHLISSTQPLRIKDIGKMMAEAEDTTLLSTYKNGLLLPLLLKSKLKGILAIGGKVSGADFSNDDIEFLSIMANQFVVALENARLYESEKNALEELKIAQKQLVVSERRAAIGELSAQIAHEVNNPLSIISNYLHLCERELQKPEQMQEHLGVLRQEFSRIAGIIRQLLDFHRPQAIIKSTVCVIETLNDLLKLVKPQLDERNITLETKIGKNIPTIFGSRDQLKQVFLNLIINARDFMSEGGKLSITASCRNNIITILFSDTGPGLKEEDIPMVFEPFFSIRADMSGTG